MLKTALTVAAFATGVAVIAPPVAAQVPCGPRDAIVQQLKASYGERQLGLGLASAERVLELWASDATGSWTLMATAPGGTTCIVASGQGWLPRRELVEGPAEEPT